MWGLISFTGSVTDKNCSELSQPEMWITQIKFKIQWSFRTFFLITPKIIFIKPRKILFTNKVAAPMLKIKIKCNQ